MLTRLAANCGLDRFHDTGNDGSLSRSRFRA